MTGGVVELDLHGMNTYQAQIAVDAALRRAGAGTYRLRLIHGYRGGTAIRDMLWLTYGRRSQVKRLVSVSEGVTELVLDFTGLEYISSAGLRVLLAAQKVMNK